MKTTVTQIVYFQTKGHYFDLHLDLPFVPQDGNTLIHESGALTLRNTTYVIKPQTIVATVSSTHIFTQQEFDNLAEKLTSTGWVRRNETAG